MSNVEITECNDFLSSILSKSSVSEAQFALSDYDYLALPSPYSEDECYYAQETIDFVKFCRETTDEFTIGILAEKDIEIRSLYSFDIFMPIIWVATTLLLPTAINVVSNYIYDKMKGREHEEANVEISFMVERDNERKMLRYKGPANEFEKEFRTIDINEL